MTTQTEKTQSATLPEFNYSSNAKNYNGDKELMSRYLVIAHNPDVEPNDYRRFITVIDCRVYMSYRSDGASPMYASIWIHDPLHDRHFSGTGKASGYGYHKSSAAIGEAIERAGIKLALPIGGRGESAVRKALDAITRELGYSDFAIVE
jgi:hypothetical protein